MSTTETQGDQIIPLGTTRHGARHLLPGRLNNGPAVGASFRPTPD